MDKYNFQINTKEILKLTCLLLICVFCRPWDLSTKLLEKGSQIIMNDHYFVETTTFPVYIRVVTKRKKKYSDIYCYPK